MLTNSLLLVESAKDRRSIPIFVKRLKQDKSDDFMQMRINLHLESYEMEHSVVSRSKTIQLLV